LIPVADTVAYQEFLDRANATAAFAGSHERL
jgi:hypothetical protein